jgi:hypothetical protein
MMNLKTLLRGLTLSCAALAPGLPAAAAALVDNNGGATGTSQFTQSSSSTLGFGSTVIVIYNDSGSFAGTGNQFTGYSRSTDGGSTFTDMGRLPANALGDAGTAHLARDTTSGAVYTTALSFTGGGLQVFRSTDGGASFSGGATLSASSSGLLPSLAVGPDHRVTVAYLDTTGPAQVIRVRSSSDGGIPSGAASVAASLATTGASGDLGRVGMWQGTGTTAAGFPTSAAPQLATNPATGQLYLVYSDNPAGADKADDFVRTSVYFNRLAVNDAPFAPAPEPGTAWLLAVALLAASARQWRSRIQRAARAAMAACALAGASTPALAIPLPLPVADGTAQFSRNNDPGVRIQTFGLLDHTVDPFGTLQFFSAGTSAPVLRASADIGPVQNFATFSGTASGFLRYSFEIAGPQGSNDPVPVDITAAGQVTGSAANGGGFEAIARWSLRDTSERILLGNSISVFFGGQDGGSDDDSFGGDQATMLRPNQEYRIVMEVLARASTGVNAVGSGDALAFVDPIFRFGAGVDTSLYTFRFSEGIGNEPASAVPEPAAPLLFVLGCAALAQARRRAGAARPGASAADLLHLPQRA